MLAVDITVKINVCGVAVLCGTVVDVDHAGVSRTDSVDLRIDFLIGDRFNGALCGDALVAFDLDLGLDVYLCLEGDVAVLDGLHIELGASDDIETGLFCGSLISIGKYFVYGILIENALSVHLFDYGTGSFSAAETGNSYIFCLTAVNFLNCRVKDTAFHLKGQLVLIFFDQFFVFQTHLCYFPPKYF